MIQTIVEILFPVTMVYAAARDVTSYEIPNWVSLAIVANFLAAAFVGSIDMSVVAWHLAAGAAVLVVGATMFFAGVFGGGDAKLLAACAVWVGWAGLAKFLLLVAILGGVLAIFIFALRRLDLPASWLRAAWLRRIRSREEGIPYAVAIALGSILIFRELPLVEAAGTVAFLSDALLAAVA